ncbi:WD40-like Beta Propeller Repeat [Fodinibius roseus]|uniref:WD40-like Beta Propeller Repeat n=1 Tax=Fodinibius roseus TaxID=1194090 RepID=A0A1M5FIA4_9BACT|nr:PD40 domain-containing protein [Fodinibius roseus]SHF90871.1 WD40-like Beta Propeller Repeat [Fodinibius roseus]
MRTTLLLLLFTCGIHTVTSAQAQFYPTQYRPPQQWEQLTTPHFNLVYARGNDSTALEMGQILEEQYPDVQQLVGGQLSGFPVILNDYNDRSNGFVTPVHFRSEIELPPIKGKSLNPQTGGWLENVGPHELVHALQFNNLGKNNIPRLLSLFSPDLARSVHGAIPSGITEGIAVYHETEGVSPDGGRGQFPFFTNQFNAVFDSDQRWSMGQMVQASASTRPFNRHYIGGHAFTAWIQETYGYETTRKALGFYMDYPFLGYGMALRHTTGSWPGQLYEQFEDDRQQALNDRPESPTAAQVQVLSIPFKGREVRRPQWLSDSTLVFYGSFYNARPGFYRYNLKSDNIKQLVTTNSVGDYRYDLSEDRSAIVYSYYDSDPIYDRTYKAELVEYKLSTGKRRQLTEGGRLYAPQYDHDRLLALQTRPASAALVSVPRHGSRSEANPLLSSRAYEITAVSLHPDENQLAVIANKGGLQGLWITGRDSAAPALSGAPDISFENGAVFDPEWHPDGDKLLFSSGFSGTHQLYEYHLRDESVTRITQARFNAFEGAYSPDGSRIAFIRQHTNERLPAVLRRSAAAGDRDTVSPSLWRPSKIKTAKMRHTVVSDSVVTASETWSREPYSPGSGWLKPRTVLPTVNKVSNRDRYQLGLSLHSNNLLQSQAYSAEMSYLEEQLWYDLSYENKQFYPGFNLRLYSEPSYFRFSTTQNGFITLLRENRSLALSVPLDFQLNQNVFSTSFFIEPEFRYSQIRFRDVGLANTVSDFANSAVSNLYGQFNIRLQQNIRDVQPNSGLVLFSELEHYWSASDLRFSNGQDDVELTSRRPTALQAGVIGFLSPLRRWNQSLRLEIEGLTQSGPVFNNQSLVSDAFSEPVLATSDNLMSLSARYTIPLLFADDGGFLLPFYLNNLYMVAFSSSVTDPAVADWNKQSRSVFGLELRTRFRISNLSFDLGIGYGYEPTRQNHHIYFGSF